MSIITVENVTKTYMLGKVEVPALKGITHNFEEGDFLAIAGASGSGKSTLLNLIGCLDSPTSGQIIVDGKNVTKMIERQLDQIRLHTIGFIFQTFNLIPVLDIKENVEMPLLLYKDINTAQRKELVEKFVEQVGLKDYIKHKPNELSGGQRQRVAIARALVTSPKIVLADEPTANLDSQTGIEIVQLLKKLNEENKTTIVFSTHDQKVIQHVRKVLYIQDGVIGKEEVR